MKKVLCFTLTFLIIISSFAPYAFAKGTDDFDYGIVLENSGEKSAETLQKVFLNFYGIDIKISSEKSHKIVLSIKGNSSDWSIDFDEESEDVYLYGGSETALSYAVEKFLETILMTSRDMPVFSSVIECSYNAEKDGTDNSELLSYKGNDSPLLPSYSDGILMTPQWVDSLIMVELRPEMASIGGTLPECKKLIDYYASVGVNGIWLPPIYDRGDYGNGYSNYGIHTLEPAITGTDDYEKGWKIVKDFVDYAHSKGIYIFFDIITWGTVYDSPLITEHPDWFDGEDWGNAKFNWDNEELRSWFVANAVDNILKTGADGYRCDCEPNYTGYDIYGEIRQTLKEKGKNIIIISEDNSARKGVYDFEQDGVFDYSFTDRGTVYSDPINFFGDGYVNIVDSVKNGKALGYSKWQNNSLKRGTSKYYVNCITNHDYQKRDVCGSEINIGYSAILAPYIPLWYMGDEFNVTTTDGVQYFNFIDYSEIYDTDNALFLESVKKMINIRRTYSDIFEYWPTNHRNGNICKVETSGFGTLQSYARYKDNKAVLVIANNDENSCGGKVKIPFDKCKIGGYKIYRITDLETGRTILEGSKKDMETFSTYTGFNQVGIYLVEGIGDSKSCSFNIEKYADNMLTFFLDIFSKIFK